VAQVEVTHIGAPHRLHHLRQTVPGFGRDQQMEVVVHDHVGMDRHLEGPGMLMPEVQQALAVLVVAHNGLAVVAALDDVVRITSNGEAGQTGHGKFGQRGIQFKWDLTPID